jgi:hypothetical protein
MLVISAPDELPYKDNLGWWHGPHFIAVAFWGYFHKQLASPIKG